MRAKNGVAGDERARAVNGVQDPLKSRIRAFVAKLLAYDAVLRKAFFQHGPFSRVETAIGRYKQVIGDGLRLRKDERRGTEIAVAAYVLNRMSGLGRPISIRFP